MQTLLYLSKNDIAAINLDMRSVIEQVEIAIRELGNGDTDMPPKTGIHPGRAADDFIHAMPAQVPLMAAAGLKWVSSYASNSARGLANISGLIVLNDPNTGVPLAVMDCTWITAARTGAATALSARYLARAESSTVGILGPGVQGMSNLRAINELFAIKTVRVFGSRRETAEQFARNMSDELGLEIAAVDHPRAAVSGLDIVVTAGPILKTPHATIKRGWLDEGSFASLVDFDSYWSREALAEADIFTTDEKNQYRYYRDEKGYFQNCPELHADLGELVTGKRKGRESSAQRTFAANLGVAIEDMAVALLVYRKARQIDVGTVLPI
ncbi:MAG: ornithine cyclodeaminase family protein [Congregibacter sp.]